MSRLNDQRKQRLTGIENPPPGKAGYTTWRRAQDLVNRGWAVTADGLPLQPGSKLILVADPEPQHSQPLPPGPEPPDPSAGESASHSDSLGGTRYSSNRETPVNPVNVWYLKDLLARDRWLYQLSILDNLGSA